MNKYLEVYNRLTDKKYKYHSVDKVYEDLEVLRPLIEKATPKKVENKKDHYVFDTTEYSHTGGECPNCKELVYCDGYNQDAYCSKCGQALDWSEDE